MACSMMFSILLLPTPTLKSHLEKADKSCKPSLYVWHRRGDTSAATGSNVFLVPLEDGFGYFFNHSLGTHLLSVANAYRSTPQRCFLPQRSSSVPLCHPLQFVLRHLFLFCVSASGRWDGCFLITRQNADGTLLALGGHLAGCVWDELLSE